MAAAAYQRIVLPLSNLILFLLGVSFVLKQERRSVLVGIGIAIVVCLLFYGVNITCQSLGRANNLDPLMATALPLIASTLLTTGLLRTISSGAGSAVPHQLSRRTLGTGTRS